MMLASKFLNPKNDYAFKRIFGTRKNKDILIHFLNDMLNFSGTDCIQEVTFLKNDQDPEIDAAKQSAVDVLCTDELGKHYIVEMQVAKGAGFEKRAQYYAAKAYGGQLMESEKYIQLKEIIFIAITDFVMFPDKAEYKSDHVVLDKKTYSHDLKDFSFTFLELPKFKKTIDELHTITEKWAYFFKHAEATHEDELAKLIGSDAVMKRAYDELNRFYWTPEELARYEREAKNEMDFIAIRDQNIAEGEAIGFTKGEAVGEAKGKVETLIQIIKCKFNQLSTDDEAHIINRLQQANEEQLTRWISGILSAATIADLFKLLEK